MPTIELLGGKVQIYQRGNSRFSIAACVKRRT